MLRQQKIYADDGNNMDTSNTSMSDVDGKNATSTTTVQPKPMLQHTYSNLSDKSFVVNEPPYSMHTTLVQLNFVKSSFTVNPCMVSNYLSCKRYFSFVLHSISKKETNFNIF